MPDRAHTQTESLLTALESRLRRLYRRTNKQLQKDLSPLLAEIYLDREDATQKQRLDYAERNGLSEIASIFADALIGSNEKAIRDINRTMLSVYGVNFSAMADFFEREAGVDITESEED